MRSLFLVMLAACGTESVPEPVSEPAPPPVEVEGELVEGEIVGVLTGYPASVELEHSSGAFTIDAFEASLDGAKAVSVPGVEPARGVSWYDADKACKAAGKRLCSEEEWMVACTGAVPVDRDRDGVFSDHPQAGRKHPYGATPDPSFCAASRKRHDPRELLTGNHPKCGTPDGVYDLEGVTKEWIGTEPSLAAVKGGSYFSIGSARCGYHKDSYAPDTSGDSSIGFRCCEGDPPASAASKLSAGGRVGDKLSDWELPLIDGGTFSTASLKGKPVVITFWASYCGPCKQELPAIAKLHEKHKASGLEVLAINVDKAEPAARKFLATTDVPFPILMDPKNTIRGMFSATTLPTTFFVTKEGVIRQRTMGYDKRFHKELVANVEAIAK